MRAIYVRSFVNKCFCRPISPARLGIRHCNVKPREWEWTVNKLAPLLCAKCSPYLAEACFHARNAGLHRQGSVNALERYASPKLTEMLGHQLLET